MEQTANPITASARCNIYEDQIKQLKHGIEVSTSVVYANQADHIIPNLLTNQIYIMRSLIKLMEVESLKTSQ